MNSIRVFCGNKAVDLIDEAHALKLAGPNVELVRKHATGEIVQVNLKNHGDCSSMRQMRGNPRRYSHDHETRDNPPQCWTLRRLPKSTADLYRLSVTDCLKKAA